MLRWIFAVIAGYFAFGTATYIIGHKSVADIVIGTVLTLLTGTVSFLLFRRQAKRKAKKVTPPVQQTAPSATETPSYVPKTVRTQVGSATVSTGEEYTHIRFRAVGVTFDNEDGMNRQTLIRRVKYHNRPFEDPSAIDVSLKPYTYTPDSGAPEDAIGIWANGVQLGNVPRDTIQLILEAMDKPGATITAMDVTGGNMVGGRRLNYGLELVVRYDN